MLNVELFHNGRCLTEQQIINKHAHIQMFDE